MEFFKRIYRHKILVGALAIFLKNSTITQFCFYEAKPHTKRDVLVTIYFTKWRSKNSNHRFNTFYAFSRTYQTF